MAVYNEADFVMQGREVQDPEIAKDGLELYYDVKGKRNSDVHKNKLLDMSGQGKDGVLSGFDYDGELSGYDGDNGLVFDGVEDTLELPKLSGIDADNFTYQLNNNVISYGEGGVVKWVKDGKVVERTGFNLVDYREGVADTGRSIVNQHEDTFSVETTDTLVYNWFSLGLSSPIKAGDKIYTSAEALLESGKPHTLRFSEDTSNFGNMFGTFPLEQGQWVKSEAVREYTRDVSYFIIKGENNRDLKTFKYEIRNIQAVNLTATFGAGNEPTLEEIQADPDKWQWLPNPMDLLEDTELKGNILGDMEDIVDASPRDRQSGKEVFTEHADDSHVHVEVDGQSYQHGTPTPDYPVEIESVNDFDVVSQKSEGGTIDDIEVGATNEKNTMGSEDKIYPLQSLDDWSRYYKNSPAIVTNPSDIAYQKWGFDGVPLENMEQVKGGMFGGAFPIHGNLQGGIDTPGTAWAGINISRMYLETNDATLLPKIKAIGDFFLNHVMDIDIWGVPFKAMPNTVTFDEVSRQWIPSTRFIHTRTFYHVAWALLEIYDATKDTKYSNLAGQLLDGATIIQLIATGQANSNELPPYFSGAMFNAINNVGGASYEPDWVTFTNTSGDVVVRATNKWIKLFGNTTRTSFDLYEEVDVNYTVKSVADNYINHLVYLYNNQELRKPDGHNLLYCFSHYEWEDEPHPDGYMIPVPTNWDFIDGVFGKDQWFTGDLMFWTIIGFAEAGQETIATSLLDRYYELRKPDSEGRLLFHDRYTAGGTPLVEDTSKSITFTALYMQARNILGDHSYDSESLTALAYYQRKSEFNTIDGSYSWDTEDITAVIENKSLGEIAYSVMENASNRTPAPEDITEDTNHPLIDKINLSLSEPLRSVGDVKDRLFKDSDGLWKVERNVREIGLKETKGWSTDDYRDKGYNYAYFRPVNFKAHGEVQSNILPLGFVADDTRETVGKTIVITFNLRDSRTGVTSTDNADNRFLKIRNYLISIEGAMVSYELATPTTETLDQELQDKLNTLKSFKGSNYVYTVQNTDNPHKEQLKPTIHATFNSKDYLKETRTLTNLLIWARELSDEELIHHNQLFLNRFNMRSDRGDGEPIEQTLNLLHGGMVGHSLEQNYTIDI